MKNLSLFLNILLLVLVAHLYYLNFSGEKPVVQNRGGEETESVATLSIAQRAGAGGFYYINADSVGKKYKFIQYMNDKLTTKRDELDKELKRKEDALINKAKDFEDRARYFTSETQYMVEADKIRKEEQKFQEYTERKTRELLEYEKQLNEEFIDNLKGQLNKMNETLQSDFIFNYNSIGGNLLICNDSLDITDQALQALNAQFEEKYGTTDDKK